MTKVTLPKPNKNGVINRQSLKKLIASGALEAKCDGHYTDDYAYDAAANFRKTEWLPARYVDAQMARHENSEPGTLTFGNWDFKTSSGLAYLDKDGSYSLHVHSNLSYTLRLKQ